MTDCVDAREPDATMYLKSALLLFFGLASACGEGGTEHRIVGNSSWDACYPSFAKQVEQLAGDQAIDCGFFDVRSPRKDFSEIKACAKIAAKSGNAFKFGHSDFGDDSFYCHAAIRDTAGELRSLFYDSDISGGGGGHSAVSVLKCRDLKFEKGTIGRHSFFDFDDCRPDDNTSEIFQADLD
ncbi:MAG: hypothetical protein AAGA09_05330 [Pseudomonadota bacterium]